jgi:hypothetical protein
VLHICTPSGVCARGHTHAVARVLLSGFEGVPIKSVSNVTGKPSVTRIETAYYTVLLDLPPKTIGYKATADAVPAGAVRPSEDTCAKLMPGVDGAPGSKRAHGGVVDNVNVSGCCAACNAAADCVAWVLSGNADCENCSCWLLAIAIAEQATNRVSGGTFSPSPPTPPPPPPSATVTILSSAGDTIFGPATVESVSASLDFPEPGAFVANPPLASWAIRDFPRCVPMSDHSRDWLLVGLDLGDGFSWS